jgi:hypothetical protein
VVIGRLGAYSGSLLGAQTRYLTDATGVLALCVALACLPLAGEENVYRFQFGTLRRPVTAVIAVVLCAAAVGSVWSLSSLQSVSTVYTGLARSYLATAQTAVADAPPGTVIVDSAVPAAVMDPGLFWNHALTSQVLGLRATPAQHLNWIRTVRGVFGVTPMIFDAQGQLRPANVVGQFSWPAPKAKSGPYAGQRCWNVTAAGTSIPLLQPIYGYGWTARVAYNGPGDLLTAGFGGRESSVTLTPGNHLAYVPVVGGGNAITLRVPGAAAPLCVYGVTVGSVQPDETAQAIPALPIPG